MKIAVVGNRTGFSKDFVFEKLREIVKEEDTIISGGAAGVDTHAENYAIKNGIKCIVFKPNYGRPSPARYFERNERIANECDVLVAFNKKFKSGTTNTIRIAKELNKKTITFG